LACHISTFALRTGFPFRSSTCPAGTVGLLLRYQDPGNHYRLLFSTTERRLERVVGGVVTSLWNSPLTTAMNRSNEITVSLLDTTLSVFQNAIAACEVVDASFAAGNIGLCKAPGADVTVSQLVLYPPGFAFSEWTVRDEFQELASDSWTLLDDGDQDSPSKWQVANDRLSKRAPFRTRVMMPSGSAELSPCTRTPTRRRVVW
jgi:hypothetical protein